MSLSNKTIERICKIFGFLTNAQQKGLDFVSSRDLAKAAGATELTVRKDISLVGVTGYDRKGYDVKALKQKLGKRLNLATNRKACIVGLGRLGTALLDYQKFQEDGFQIITGFDSNINKIERLKTDVDVYGIDRIKEVVQERGIELGIITVPSQAAQETADMLVSAGVKGILNFSPVTVDVPEEIIYLDMDFTNALRFIAARLVK